MSGTATSPDTVPGPRSPWILDRGSDLLLFVATPVLIIPLILAARSVIDNDEMIYAIVVAFGATGHHLPGLMRAYGDRALFRRFRVRFIVTPVFLVGVTLPLLLSEHWRGVIVVLLLWGFWHGLMQVYGFVRIYDAKIGSTSRTTARLDWLICVAWFGAGLVCSDGRMFLMAEAFYQAGGPLLSPAWVEPLRQVWLAGTLVLTVIWSVHTYRQHARGQSTSPVKLLTMAVSFAFWWYAMVHIDSVIVGIAMFEVFHDVQYLAIVWVFNRKRVDQQAGVGGFTRFLFRRSWAMVGVYVGLVMAYGLFGYLKELEIVADAELIKKVLMSLIFTSTLLHFYFDGFIWKVRERSTQAGLGIGTGQATEETRPLTDGLLHALKWTPFVLVVGWLAIAQWWNTGIYGDEVSKKQRELKEYRNLARLVPDYPRGHLVLGTQLAGRRLVDDAAAECRAAIDRAGGRYGDAHYNLALMLVEQNRRLVLGKQHDEAADRLDEAILTYRTALGQRTKFAAESHFGLAAALRRRNGHDDRAAAEQEFLAALKTNRNFAVAHLGLGELYAETGQLELAEKHLVQALELFAADQAGDQLERSRRGLEQVRSRRTGDPVPTP